MDWWGVTITKPQTGNGCEPSWLSSAEFTNIVAVSRMTLGPIGINSAATYCGIQLYIMGFGAGMASG